MTGIEREAASGSDSHVHEVDGLGANPHQGRSRRQVQLILGVVVAIALLVVIGVVRSSSGGDDSGADLSSDIDKAVAMITAGDSAGARSILERIIADDPLNTLANYNLGVIAQFAGDNNSAIGFYSIVVQQDPLFANATYNLGLAYRDTGQTDLAISTLTSLIQNYPDNASGLYNLGKLLVENGDPSLGNAYLARAKKLDPLLGS